MRRFAPASIALLLLLVAGCAPRGVRTGLDVLVEEGFAPLRGKRVGLITNHSGVDRRLRSTVDLLRGAEGVTLAALFGPEHGIRGSAAAGKEVGDAVDPRTGIPVHSLYGEARKPTPEMLRGLDALVYDLQDVGARPYTYLSTLRLAMEAAAEAGIELWVLDRPDPTGGEVLEGPVLEAAHESFVGTHPIPIRHAMTPGELARMLDRERRIGTRLQVVAMRGWRRGMAFEETGLPWVAPSPNIPTPASCLVYPGFVLIEGTNLSEGRGTTRPFQLLGAPWLDAEATAADLNRLRLPGVTFRPSEFTPTASKHQGTSCQAVEVHITDPRTFRSTHAAVAAIALVRARHPREFRFLEAGFDRLAGTEGLRKAIERGESPEAIVRSWGAALADFERRRRAFLLYR